MKLAGILTPSGVHFGPAVSPSRSNGAQFARGEAARAFQYGIDHIGRGRGKTFGFGERGDVDDMVEHEALIGSGGREHGNPPIARGLRRYSPAPWINNGRLSPPARSRSATIRLRRPPR
jgi:hypothetical protein